MLQIRWFILTQEAWIIIIRPDIIPATIQVTRIIILIIILDIVTHPSLIIIMDHRIRMDFMEQVLMVMEKAIIDTTNHHLT